MNNTKKLTITKDKAENLQSGDVILDRQGSRWEVCSEVTKEDINCIFDSHVFGLVKLKHEKAPFPGEYYIGEETGEPSLRAILFIGLEEVAVNIDLSSPDARILKKE